MTFSCQITFIVDLLGRRLETECDGDLSTNADLCYIVAGNIDQLVANWSRTVPDDTSCVDLQVGACHRRCHVEVLERSSYNRRVNLFLTTF